MGYIRRDMSGPTISKYIYKLSFKNTILRHWPTKVVGGVKVFDRLMLYYHETGVYKTPSHLALYRLLGMKVKDLETANYKGVSDTFLSISGVDLTYAILQTQIQSYIELNSPQIYPLSKDPFNPDPSLDTRLNPDPYRDNPEWVYDVNYEAIDTTIPEPQWDKDGWITTYLTYNPPVTADVPESIGDAAILGLIEAGDRTNIHFDDEEDHPLVFASLLDTGNILFENKVRIVQKSIEERTANTYVLNSGNLNSNGSTTSRYLKTAVIEYRFRRVKDAHDASVATLIAKIETEMEALTLKLNEPTSLNITRMLQTANTFGTSLNSSVSKQLIRMYHHENGNSETALSYNGYLKYDAMATLKAKDFGRIFSKQIKTGYSLKKVKLWKKVVGIILVIIVVIIAILIIIYSLGSGTPLAMAMVYGAMALAFGALALSMLAGYIARSGDPAYANYLLGGAEYLQLAATVVSAVANPMYFVAMQGLMAIAKSSDTGAAIVGAALIIGMAYGMYDASSTQSAATDAGNAAAAGVAANGGDVIAQSAAAELAKAAVLNGTQIATYSLAELSNMTIGQLGDVGLQTVQSILTSGVQSTSNLMISGLQVLNMAYSFYVTYVDPPPSMEAKQKELADSERLLEDTTGPETLDTIEVEYSDPFTNWIDMNEKMQSIPYMMTQGKNRLLMNKYYNSGY